MRHVRGAAAFIFVLWAAGVPATGFELDVGAGITIDVTPVGIEAVEPLAIVAPWFGPRDGLQAGAVVAGSLSANASDIAAALCLRVWPAPDRAALYGGAGILLAPGQDPAVMPYLLGGLRFEVRRFALVAPGLAMRLYPDGSDTEVWLAALWRL